MIDRYMIGIIIASVILGVLLLLFLIVFILYRITYRSPFRRQLNDFNLPVSKNYKSYPKLKRDLIDKFMARSFEDVYITSYDELRLHARVFTTRGSGNKVAILCHGYRGAAYRDFCAASKVLFELKYNVILIDQRGHGLSDGHKITFGIRESKDLLSWIDYAKERFTKDADIVLFGVSMGGHTVLNVSDQIDKKIKIIADSPYVSIEESLKNTIRSIHLPVFLVYPLVKLAGIMFVHENMNRNNVLDRVRDSKNQIMIIHGSGDTVIPYEFSMLIAATYPSKVRYELFRGAEHCNSYLVDYDWYNQIIKDFLSNK